MKSVRYKISRSVDSNHAKFTAMASKLQLPPNPSHIWTAYALWVRDRRRTADVRQDHSQLQRSGALHTFAALDPIGANGRGCVKILDVKQNLPKTSVRCIMSRFWMNFYSGARNERDERRHGSEFSHSLGPLRSLIKCKNAALQLSHSCHSSMAQKLHCMNGDRAQTEFGLKGAR
jgi:hypothetical protein